MKKIVYYITDHGMGHATRAIALIQILKSNYEIIIRNSNNTNLFKKSLNLTSFSTRPTDVGPKIKSDGITLDENKSKPVISDWINSISNNASLEYDFLSKINPDLIISDISAMPFLAAKKSKISSIAISNFSWLDVLSFISSNELNILNQCYDYADYAIKLPFGTSMKHFSNIQKTKLISRNLTQSKSEIRKFLGINESDLIITVALGNSNLKIHLKSENNIKIISLGGNILTGNNIINLNSYIEGQNIIAASDLVICKCGYGIVSECVSHGIPFFYIADNNHLEQKAISDELVSANLGKRIIFSDLEHYYFTKKFIHDLKTSKKIAHNNILTTNLISEFMDK